MPDDEFAQFLRQQHKSTDSDTQRQAIERGASDLGVNPIDYATAISYESAGTFDPWVKGPRTKYGQHRGTIQYGEPQQKKYGVYEGQSFEDQVTRSNVQYLKDAGVKPGMSFAQMYAAINGGSASKDLNTQDWTTGRTIADNIRIADKEHRPQVLKKFWGSTAPQDAFGTFLETSHPKDEFAEFLSQSTGTAPISPTVPNQQVLQGIQPDAITSQVQRAMDAKSPHAAVLTTDPTQAALIGNQSGLTAFPLTRPEQPKGTLWVNREKARKLKLKTDADIQQFINANPDGISRLTGKVKNIPDMSQGPTVQTKQAVPASQVAPSVRPRQTTHVDTGTITDVPGEAPTTQPQSVTEAQSPNAVAETVSVKGAKDAHEAAVKVLQQLAPKYGFDADKVLAANPGLELQNFSSDGDAQVTYGDLANFGVDTKPLVREKIAQERIENPKIDALHVAKEDFAKEDATDLNKTLGDIGTDIGKSQSPQGGVIGKDVGEAVSGFLGQAFQAASGGSAEMLKGFARFVNEMSPTKGESMAEARGAKKHTPRLIETLDDISSSTKTFAQHTGNDGTLSWIAKTGGQVAGSTPRLMVLSALPGGIVTAMSLEHGVPMYGEQGATPETLKQFGKGAAFGAVFKVAPFLSKVEGAGTVGENALEQAITVGNIGAGSYATSRAFGSTPKEAFADGIMNGAFHLFGELQNKVVNRPIRARDKSGKEAVVEIKDDGKVETLPPDTPAEIEMVIPEASPRTQTEKAEIPRKAEALETNESPESLELQRQADLEPKVKESSAETERKIKASSAEVGRQEDIEAPISGAQAGAKPPKLGSSGGESDVKAVESQSAKPIIGKGVVSEPPKIPTERPENKATSTKNAVVEAERAERNLSPIEKTAKREFGKAWDEAAKIVEENPRATEDLVADIIKKPRALTDTENALLLHRRIAAKTAYDTAATKVNDTFDGKDEGAKIEARLELARASDELYDVDRASRMAGTETGRGLAARRMMANDDYTLAALETRKRAVNGGRKLTDIERTKLEQIAKDYKAKSDVLEARLAERENAVSAMKTRAELAEAKNEGARPFIEKAEQFVAKLDKRADAARERLKKRGAVFTSGLDPLALKDLADIGASHIAKLGLDFAKFSDAMITEFGEKVKPHLEDIFKVAKRSSQINQNDGLAAIKTRLQNQIVSLEQQIQTKTRTVTTRAKPVYDEETQGLIKKRDELKAERDKLLPQKGAPMSVERKPTLYKRGLEARIEQLEKQIETGEKPKRGSKVPVTPEITALKAKRDALKAQLPEVDKSISDAQYNKNRETSLNKQIADLETQISTKERLIKEKTVREVSPKVGELIDKRDELKKQFTDVFGKPEMSESQRLDAFKTRATKRIEELEEKIATQDFSKKTRKPLHLDREAGGLQIEINRLKRSFESDLMKDRMRNRTKSEKAQDFVANWARMSFLSWPSTLAKLTSAAVQRAVYAPIEEVIGGAYSKALPSVARRSPSEAGLNIKAEAKTFTQGLWEGMKESGRMLKMKDKNLHTLYGEHDYPGPANKVDAVMQYFGVLHGALKAPVETMGFTRSLEKRVAHAMKNGVDVTNPLIEMDLGLQALKDGKRQIFMQDNRVVTAYKRFIQTLEQPQKGTGKPTASGKLGATALKVTFPVVKIPMNIAGEVVQYAAGLAVGGGKVGAMHANRAGILPKVFKKSFESLSPDEADLIMRQLKKGTVGPALILLGYFNPQAIGGYYQPGQKRDPDDVKFGSIKIGGYNIPSTFLHNPATEMLQIGATIRRVADSKFKKSDTESRGLIAGMIAASTGVAEEIPFVKQTTEAAQALDPRSLDEFTDEFIKSRAVPGLLQWTANKLDRDNEGNTIKRKPENFFEHIESGIPGLRTEVPLKGVAGIKAANNDALKKDPRYQRATTNDLVEAVKTMKAQGLDTKKMEDNLLEKARNAAQGHTLTDDEIKRIQKVIPSFEHEERPPKVKKGAKGTNPTDEINSPAKKL